MTSWVKSSFNRQRCKSILYMLDQKSTSRSLKQSRLTYSLDLQQSHLEFSGYTTHLNFHGFNVSCVKRLLYVHKNTSDLEDGSTQKSWTSVLTALMSQDGNLFSAIGRLHKLSRVAQALFPVSLPVRDTRLHFRCWIRHSISAKLRFKQSRLRTVCT